MYFKNVNKNLNTPLNCENTARTLACLRSLFARKKSGRQCDDYDDNNCP